MGFTFKTLECFCYNFILSLIIIMPQWFKNVNNGFFFFFATPRGLWDFSSLTRDRTQALGSDSTEP